MLQVCLPKGIRRVLCLPRKAGGSRAAVAEAVQHHLYGYQQQGQGVQPHTPLVHTPCFKQLRSMEEVMSLFQLVDLALLLLEQYRLLLWQASTAVGHKHV